MTWDDAVDALLDHFHTRWTALHPTIPIDVPNGKPVSVAVDTGTFVRIRFQSSFTKRDSTGGGHHRFQGGRVLVNVFSPPKQGDGNARAYDREIESIFETAKANGLTGDIGGLDEPLPIGGFHDPDTDQYVSGVSVPFFFQHAP